MNQSVQAINKAVVLRSIDTLLTSGTTRKPNGIGRPTTFSIVRISRLGAKGLFNLIKGIPPSLKYEPGVIAAEGDFGSFTDDFRVLARR